MSLFIAIIAAFVLTFILMPIIIKVSKSIDLLDIPDRRKIHSVGTPSFGGVAVFMGFVLSVLICVSVVELAQFKFFLAGMMMIFLLGVRDDVSSLQAKQKLAVQLLSSVLVVYFADMKLNGFYGLFGLDELPIGLAGIVSIIMIVVLTNSFNLVDGIDGLAGSLAIVILSVFAYFFVLSGQTVLAVMCIALVGALLAFLFFNWFPSQVFMGDTGSMFLGFTLSVLCINFIDKMSGFKLANDNVVIHAPVAVAISILIVPIYDTLRVFTIRLSKGLPPLAPDRNHIHHSLLNLGLNHSKATIILAVANISNIFLALGLDGVVRQEVAILICFGMMVFFGFVIHHIGKRRNHMVVSEQSKKQKSLYISKSA